MSNSEAPLTLSRTKPQTNKSSLIHLSSIGENTRRPVSSQSQQSYEGLKKMETSGRPITRSLARVNSFSTSTRIQPCTRDVYQPKSTADDTNLLTILKSDTQILQNKIDSLTRGIFADSSTRSFNDKTLSLLSVPDVALSKNQQARLSLLENLIEKLAQLQVILINKLLQLEPDIHGERILPSPATSLSFIQPFIQVSDRITSLAATANNYCRVRNKKEIYDDTTAKISALKLSKATQIDLINLPDQRQTTIVLDKTIQTDSNQTSKNVNHEKVIRKNEKELKRYASDLNNCRERIEYLEIENEKLQKSLLTMVKEKNQKESSESSPIDLSRLKEQHQFELNTMIKELTIIHEQRVEEMAKKHEEALNLSRKATKSNLEELQQQNDDLKKQLLEYQQHKTQTDANLVELKEASEKSNLQVKQLKEQIQSLESHKVKLQQQIINIKDKNINLVKETKRGEEELSRLREIEVKYMALKKDIVQLERIQKSEEESLVQLKSLHHHLEKAEEKYHKLEGETAELRISAGKHNALYKEAKDRLREERSKREQLERLLSELKHNPTRKQDLEILKQQMEDKDRYITKLQQRNQEYKDLLEQPSKPAFNIEAFIEILGRHENNILNQELTLMREAFEKKLENATNELQVIRKSYENQVEELHRALAMERSINERKIQKFKERCEFLEERLRKLE